jgi:hypothetical protein
MIAFKTLVVLAALVAPTTERWVPMIGARDSFGETALQYTADTKEVSFASQRECEAFIKADPDFYEWLRELSHEAQVNPYCSLEP